VWKVAQRPDGRVVGFQVLEPFGPYTKAFDHVGTLGTYVDLDHRRQGIARTLFAATFEAARQKSYEKIFTFVRADNSPALATYTAQGFQVVGTAHRQAKIDGRYIDEILIEKVFD
jgi:L-amino acid N-acyltransferase YncA